MLLMHRQPMCPVALHQIPSSAHCPLVQTRAVPVAILTTEAVPAQVQQPLAEPPGDHDGV